MAMVVLYVLHNLSFCPYVLIFISDMNLPLCAVAMVVVFFFLQLKSPRDSFREKLMKLDWFGNALIIASTTACILGLTWGGIKYPWSSPRVLCPLIFGVVGLGAAILYEIKWAKQPTVSATSNETGCMIILNKPCTDTTCHSIKQHFVPWVSGSCHCH